MGQPNAQRNVIMDKYNQCIKKALRNRNQRLRDAEQEEQVRERQQYEQLQGANRIAAGERLCKKAISRLPPASNRYCQETYEFGGNKPWFSIGKAKFQLKQDDQNPQRWFWVKMAPEEVRTDDGRVMKRKKGYKPKYNYEYEMVTGPLGTFRRRKLKPNAAVLVRMGVDDEPSRETPEQQKERFAAAKHQGSEAKAGRLRYRVAAAEKKKRGPNTAFQIWEEATRTAEQSGALDTDSAIPFPVYDPTQGWLPPKKMSLDSALLLYYYFNDQSKARGGNVAPKLWKRARDSLKLDSMLIRRLQSLPAVQDLIASERMRKVKGGEWPMIDVVIQRMQDKVKALGTGRQTRDKERAAKAAQELIRVLRRLVIAGQKNNKRFEGIRVKVIKAIIDDNLLSTPPSALAGPLRDLQQEAQRRLDASQPNSRPNTRSRSRSVAASRPNTSASTPQVSPRRSDRLRKKRNQ